MNTARRFILFSLLLLGCATFTRAGEPVTDAIVERFMKTFRYQEAAARLKVNINRAESGDSREMLYNLNRLSMAYYRLGYHDSALMIARKSLKLMNEVSDSVLITDAWKVASYAYNLNGILDSALNYSMKILAYSERHGDDALTKKSLNALASILIKNKRYREALDMFLKSRDLTVKLKDSTLLPGDYFNLGAAWTNLKQHDSAMINLQKAIDFSLRMKNMKILTLSYGAMADCYQYLNNKDEWKKYLLLANASAIKTGDITYAAMNYSSLATNALMERNYPDAIKYGKEANKILDDRTLPALKQQVDSVLYAALKATGNMAEALRYYESHVRISEKIVTENLQKQLNEVMVKFRVKEQDMTIANQELEITRNEKNQQLLLLAVIFLSVCLGGLIYYELIMRRHRKELFRKEKELDREMNDIKVWMSLTHDKPFGSSVREQPEKHIQLSGSEQEYGLTTQQLLYRELLILFENEKIYRDPDLNQEMVIRLLGTNRKYLQDAMREGSESNFRHFISRYRVNEAKEIISAATREEKEYDLSETIVLTGYSSTTSFYRDFKNTTGLTPGQYVAELRREMKGT